MNGNGEHGDLDDSAFHGVAMGEAQSALNHGSGVGAAHASEHDVNGTAQAESDAASAPRVARSASGHAAQGTHASDSPGIPAVSGSVRSSRSRRAVPGARRMNLSLTRFDAWSVAKVSFLLGVAGAIIQIVAAGLVWGLLNVVGVFDQVTHIVSSAGLDAGGVDLADVFSLSTVLSVVTIFSIIEVVLVTVLVTIVALLYNVVSSLVGGVHITLGDD